MLQSNTLLNRTGTCEMCGEHNQKLKMLILIGSFIGWVCPQCMDQVSKSIHRRFVGSGEHTEPEE